MWNCLLKQLDEIGPWKQKSSALDPLGHDTHQSLHRLMAPDPCAEFQHISAVLIISCVHLHTSAFELFPSTWETFTISKTRGYTEIKINFFSSSFSGELRDRSSSRYCRLRWSRMHSCGQCLRACVSRVNFSKSVFFSNEIVLYRMHDMWSRSHLGKSIYKS